jgi:uncharacterized membrane protein YadS
MQKLRTLFANHLWIAILFGISISVIVNLSLNYFFSERFQIPKFVGAIVFGIFLGFLIRSESIHKIKTPIK